MEVKFGKDDRVRRQDVHLIKECVELQKRSWSTVPFSTERANTEYLKKETGKGYKIGGQT